MSDTSENNYFNGLCLVAIILLLLCVGIPAVRVILRSQDRIESKIDHLSTKSIQSKDTTNDD